MLVCSVVAGLSSTRTSRIKPPTFSPSPSKSTTPTITHMKFHEDVDFAILETGENSPENTVLIENFEDNSAPSNNVKI